MQLELAWFLQLFTYLSPQFFFPYTVTILLIWRHIFPHIYTPILLIFHPFPKKNQAVFAASKHLKRTGQGVGLFTLSESSWFRPVWTRSVPSNILARRQNVTETWWRCSCQREHLRLNTHEKILLNGDVPWRNGNMTYSVNRLKAACRQRRFSAPLSHTL